MLRAVSDYLGEMELLMLADALQRAKLTSKDELLVTLQCHLDWVHMLGKQVERVARGENARRVFGQHKRTKPRSTIPVRVAMIYWAARSVDPRAKDAAALREVRLQLPDATKLADSTLRGLAKRHRSAAFRLLELFPSAYLPEGDTRPLAELQRYLARKSGSSGGRPRRENVDE